MQGWPQSVQTGITLRKSEFAQSDRSRNAKSHWHGHVIPLSSHDRSATHCHMHLLPDLHHVPLPPSLFLWELATCRHWTFSKNLFLSSHSLQTRLFQCSLLPWCPHICAFQHMLCSLLSRYVDRGCVVVTCWSMWVVLSLYLCILNSFVTQIIFSCRGLCKCPSSFEVINSRTPSVAVRIDPDQQDLPDARARGSIAAASN